MGHRLPLMVNFRFHLVSLAAVFLALAAGIVIGAGVVDRQTVALLESRLEDVRENRNVTNRENDELRSELDRWTRFSEQAGTRMVEGTLVGTPVLLVGISGTDRGVVDGVRETLGAAGAAIDGTVWFTGKWGLTDEGDRQQLAALLEVPATLDPAELRTAALTRVVAGWVTGTGADATSLLRDRGFLDFQAPAGVERGLEQVPSPGATFVVVADRDADVAAADLSGPMVVQLADAGLRVLAAQPVPRETPAGTDAAAVPTGLVAAVRDDEGLAARLSTVDNVDDYRGRVAIALAVAELGRGRVGHYGVLPGAQRLLPEPEPSA